MRRRRLCATLGAGVCGLLAGCSVSSDDPATTTTAAPEPSRLRLRVENEDTAVNGLTARLAVTTGDVDRYEFFTVSDVALGATRTTSARDLPAGRYELRLEFDLGSSTIRWTGRECADKLVVVRFTDEGVVVSDRCPADE
jgi:hypothetical protein